MAYFQRLIISVLLSCSGWFSLTAAEKEDPALLSAMWLDGKFAPLAELFIVDAKGKPQALIVGVDSRGAPVDLPAGNGGIVILSKALVAAPDNPIPGYEKAGEIARPAGKMSRVLLLLASSGRAVEKVRVGGVALHDDTTRFPPNTMLFANFLDGEVASKVGNSVITIPAGISAAIPYAKKPEPDSKRIPVFEYALAQTSKSGAANIFYKAYGEAWPNSRLLVIIIPSSKKNRTPVVSSIRDAVKPPAPSP